MEPGSGKNTNPKGTPGNLLRTNLSITRSKNPEHTGRVTVRKKVEKKYRKS
jgi:hypothetical protein